MIQDPATLLAALAATVAGVFQLARWPRAGVVFDRLPPLVWCYALPMLLTTAGVFPAASPLYTAMRNYLLPASLVLLMISSEIKDVLRLGRRALLMMTAAMAGIMAGSIVAFLLYRHLLPAESWKAMGTLTATWIGGSANLLAVATMVGLPPELQGVIIAIDTVVGYSWTAVLIALAGRQARIDAWTGADRSALEEISSRLAERRAATARPAAVADTTLMVGVALVVTVACREIGARLPPVGNPEVLNAFGWAILVLTLVGLLLSLTPLARLESAGASTLGYTCFYVLLASVGAQADLRRVAENPWFVLVGITVIAVHALVLLAALRLTRSPFFFFAATSQACTGGVSSAPIVAGLYLPAMAPVGLLLAVLGNVVGNVLGLAVAWLLSRWS